MNLLSARIFVVAVTFKDVMVAFDQQMSWSKVTYQSYRSAIKLTISTLTVSLAMSEHLIDNTTSAVVQGDIHCSTPSGMMAHAHSLLHDCSQ